MDNPTHMAGPLAQLANAGLAAWLWWRTNKVGAAGYCHS